MRPHLESFEAAGCQVAVVGSGWPDAARGFARALGLPPSLPVLCDQPRRSFALLGLRRSIAATLLVPRVVRKWFALRRRGFKQGRVRGDPWQQGGAAVIAPGGHGRLLYRFASRTPDDIPDPAALLEAARAAVR